MMCSTAETAHVVPFSIAAISGTYFPSGSSGRA
jgi:hypothetical protein